MLGSNGANRHHCSLGWGHCLVTTARSQAKTADADPWTQVRASGMVIQRVAANPWASGSKEASAKLAEVGQSHRSGLPQSSHASQAPPETYP